MYSLWRSQDWKFGATPSHICVRGHMSRPSLSRLEPLTRITAQSRTKNKQSHVQPTLWTTKNSNIKRQTLTRMCYHNESTVENTQYYRRLWTDTATGARECLYVQETSWQRHKETGCVDGEEHGIKLRLTTPNFHSNLRTHSTASRASVQRDN